MADPRFVGQGIRRRMGAPSWHGDMALDDDEDNGVPNCPMCGSDSSSTLGVLGQRAHYRCRNCGYDHSEGPADDDGYGSGAPTAYNNGGMY